MERYRNTTGRSGVEAFGIGSDFITVRFTGKFRTYTYSYRSAGESSVEKMKILASRGSGLNAFINKHVKHKYEKF